MLTTANRKQLHARPHYSTHAPCLVVHSYWNSHRAAGEAWTAWILPSTPRHRGMATASAREATTVKLAHRPHWLHVTVYGAPLCQALLYSSGECCTPRLHTACLAPVLHQGTRATEVLPAKIAALPACKPLNRALHSESDSMLLKPQLWQQGTSYCCCQAHDSTDQPQDCQPACSVGCCSSDCLLQLLGSFITTAAECCL